MALPPRPMAVVFGRPGSGKNTVADAVIQRIGEDCLGLDLDVCVSQSMRDNFAKEIYPNLQERQAFALEACDYVTTSLEEAPEDTTSCCVVSFSFVNSDLCESFKETFPDAEWLLVDTSELEATKRINAREGYFYKGQVMTDDEGTSKPRDTSDDWDFDPVTFDHIVLNGMDSIESNADKVIQSLEALLLLRDELM